MQKKLLIFVPLAVLLILVLILIFTSFNRPISDNQNNSNSTVTSSQQVQIVSDGQPASEKPRFTGQKLDDVKNLCDYKRLVNDIFASDFEQTKKIDFDPIVSKLDTLPRQLAYREEFDFNDYKSILNRYKEVLKSANARNFFDVKLEYQKEAQGMETIINRHYECKN
jgi:hypothetical protein